MCALHLPRLQKSGHAHAPPSDAKLRASCSTSGARGASEVARRNFVLLAGGGAGASQCSWKLHAGGQRMMARAVSAAKHGRLCHDRLAAPIASTRACCPWRGVSICDVCRVQLRDASPMWSLHQSRAYSARGWWWCLRVGRAPPTHGAWATRTAHGRREQGARARSVGGEKRENLKGDTGDGTRCARARLGAARRRAARRRVP